MRTFLLIFLTAALVSCSTGRYDWPRWRGPAGDNISKEKGWNPKALEGGPRVAWEVNVGEGYSGVAIKGSRLYTMGCDPEKGGFAYCLNAVTGKELWRCSFPGLHPPQATPTIDESSVYCLTYDGLLFCLDAGSGMLRWKRDVVADDGVIGPYYGFAGSPVVVGNLVVVTANTSGMALDKRTGTTVWVSEPPPRGGTAFPYSTGTEYDTPVIYSRNGKPHALICSWKGVFSVEVETGKPLLVFDWEKAYISFLSQTADPLIADGKVVIVGGKADYPGSFCLDVKGLETRVLWKSRDTFSELGSPVLLDGHLYVCQGGGNSRGWLRCLDAETGTVVWEVNPAGQFWRSSISFTVADGKLIVLDDKGLLSIGEASPSGFRVIASANVLAAEEKPLKFWTPPVLCNGRIYCRNLPGDLVCVDVRK